MLSDDELVEQILLGNENVAEELIKRYYTIKLYLSMYNKY